MTIEDFKDILAGIRDNKIVCIPYQLHRDNQINAIIEALGGPAEAFDYFTKVSEAQPANFYENQEEYEKKLKEVKSKWEGNFTKVPDTSKFGTVVAGEGTISEGTLETLTITSSLEREELLNAGASLMAKQIRIAIEEKSGRFSNEDANWILDRLDISK